MQIDLISLPKRMAKLPVDPVHGVPVPWFVSVIDGRFDFRIMDRVKFHRALKERLCWVCGEPLGRWLVFPLGPMCTITRTTQEPHCHLDCAQWSVRNCPFLSNPATVRRTEGLPPEARTAGYGIMRNPGVTALWVARSYERFRVEGDILLTVGDPDRVEWYREGRAATRAEVEDSIGSGLPNLLAMAQKDGPFAVRALGEQVDRAKRWLPAPQLVEAP